MRFSWTKGRGMIAVSAALIALQGAPAAFAQQFVPYMGGQQQTAPQYQPAPQYQAAQQYQAAPQYRATQQAPMYTAMAYQGNNAHSVVESIDPGQAIADPATNQSTVPTPAMNYPQPTPAFESYPASNSSCAANAYNTFDGGSYGLYAPQGGCGRGGCNLGCCNRCNTGRQWFGGFYGLYMQRAGNTWRGLAFSTDTANVPPYYPTDTEYVLNLRDLDQDNFGGAEVRFGSTLGGGCCGPRHGWEAGYWGLLEETTTAVATDVTGDTNRLYGMIDYRGLEADMGAGYRPVNHYFDFGPPTTDNTAGGDIEIRTLTARNTFSAQSIELNLLHFTLFGNSAFAGAYGGGYGGGIGGGIGRGLGSRAFGGQGGCAAGGCDTCAGGCGAGGCGCGSRFSTTCLVGVRYFRADDDFMYRSDWENTGTAATGFISNNIDVDNHLVGAQFGCNSCYRCGCSGRWALHCNSVVGVYNNHSEVWNRFDSPTNDVRYTNGTNANFNLRYEDDHVAVLGELRAGASYQYSCNWRLYGGYRLVGVSGLALAFDQIPTPAAITPNQTSYVDSNGSIFLHGLQCGVECTY